MLRYRSARVAKTEPRHSAQKRMSSPVRSLELDGDIADGGSHFVDLDGLIAVRTAFVLFVLVCRYHLLKPHMCVSTYA
jgi:hypothetical protein